MAAHTKTGAMIENSDASMGWGIRNRWPVNRRGEPSPARFRADGRGILLDEGDA